LNDLSAGRLISSSTRADRYPVRSAVRGYPYRPRGGATLVSSTGTPDILNTAPGTSPLGGALACWVDTQPGGRGRGPSPSALYWIPLGLDLLASAVSGLPGWAPHHPGRGPSSCGRRLRTEQLLQREKGKPAQSSRLGGEATLYRRLVLEQGDLVRRHGGKDFGGAKLPTRRATAVYRRWCATSP
jgi:hypothetical protein